MNLFYGAVAVIAVFMLSGCAATVKMSDFREMDNDLKESEIKPPEYILNKKKPKVAILPLEDTTRFGGKLSKSAQETVSQVISNGCGLEILERGQIEKIFQETKFGESVGVDTDFSRLTNYAKDVDYVLVGSITSARADASFTEASSWVDKKGVRHAVAASCSVKGEAAVNIRSVSTASGSVQKVFKPFKANVSSDTEVRSSYECRVNDPEQLVSAAVVKAIESARHDFQDAFPNYGYISKTMTNPQNPKVRIAYISLGKNDGLKAHDKLTAGKFVKTVDRIKKREQLVIHDLGEVVVNATGLADNECIVTIPEEFSGEIVAGYIVKTKANRGFFN